MDYALKKGNSGKGRRIKDLRDDQEPAVRIPVIATVDPVEVEDPLAIIAVEVEEVTIAVRMRPPSRPLRASNHL